MRHSLLLCVGQSAKPDEAALRKKTDAPSPDDPKPTTKEKKEEKKEEEEAKKEDEGGDKEEDKVIASPSQCYISLPVLRIHR